MVLDKLEGAEVGLCAPDEGSALVGGVSEEVTASRDGKVGGSEVGQRGSADEGQREGFKVAALF